MVNYSYIVCIPSNTPSTTPYRTEIEIRHDTILNILIFIPSGHMGITGIRIKYGPKQLIPHEPCEWIKGDNIPIYSSGPIRLPETPTKLIVEGYNDSTSYDHCFYIYIDAIDWIDYPLGGRLDQLVDSISRLESMVEKVLESMGLIIEGKEEKAKERESIFDKIRRMFTGG